MATALQFLQSYGLDFAILTPFTEDEARAVLGLSGSAYLQAKRDGALTCSVTMPSDPLGRLRFHSLWDLIECAARIDAGWPLIPLYMIEGHIVDASESIFLSLFEEEPGPAAKRRAPCRSIPLFWQDYQTSEPSTASDDRPIQLGHAEAIASKTHNAFWKTLDQVNRLLPDTEQLWPDEQSESQLSLEL